MEKQYIIKITDSDVYINDRKCYCPNKIDKSNDRDDMNKKAIVALANEMGYEPIFLFEEIVDRLDEMLNNMVDKMAKKRRNKNGKPINT